MNDVSGGMTSIGLRGVGAAFVDAGGCVHRDGWKEPLSWWVAAADRWHDPQREPSVRQRQVDGTPVVETKVAVPGGDVVQRVFVVADQGGAVVMQLTNQSTQALAVALPTTFMSTTAATQGSLPAGVQVPDDVRVFPLAHGSDIVCAWPLDRPRWRRKPTLPQVENLASYDAVARGWLQAAQRASRISSDNERLVAARCAVLMASAHDLDDLLQRQPVTGVLAIGERVRMGDPTTEWVAPIADAVQRIARRCIRTNDWTTVAERALAVAGFVLHEACEPDASDDVQAVWQNLCRQLGRATPEVSDTTEASISDGDRVAHAARAIAAAEHRYVHASLAHEVELLPNGISPAWHGVNMEAHDVFASPRHRVSLALRWHGENLAVLWEVHGPAGLALRSSATDSSFATTEPTGEALLRVGR